MAVIGFIGLGNMGGPMAANLVRHGHAVRGFDLSPRCGAAAAAAGVEVVADPSEVAKEAEAVVTMLPGGAHVLDVYRAVVASAGSGTLLIDSSTIDVEFARGGRMSWLRRVGCFPWTLPYRAEPEGRHPERLRSWWVAARAPSRGRVRSSTRWVVASCIAAEPARDKRRKSATT